MNSSNHSCPAHHWYVAHSIPPSGYLAIGSIIGITLQELWGAIPTIILAIFFATALLLISKYIRITTNHGAFIISGILIGTFSVLYHTSQSIPPNLLDDTIMVRAIVIDKEETGCTPWATRLTLQTHAFRKNRFNAWTPTTLRIRLYLSSPCDAELDDIITMPRIKLTMPKNPSMQKYFAREGVVATSFLYKLTYYLETRPSYSLYRTIYQKRKELMQQLSCKMSSQNFALFASLFAGNKKENPQEINEATMQFRRWGTIHYLARSGLHLAILVLLWRIPFRWLPLPWCVKIILQMIATIIYAALSWPSVSFMRAFIALMGSSVYDILKIPSTLLHILSIACLLMLIKNPHLIFFLDFQLSFLLTAALGIFNRIQAVTTHRAQES